MGLGKGSEGYTLLTTPYAVNGTTVPSAVVLVAIAGSIWATGARTIVDGQHEHTEMF